MRKIKEGKEKLRRVAEYQRRKILSCFRVELYHPIYNCMQKNVY
jgi:hypothetical protein